MERPRVYHLGLESGLVTLAPGEAHHVRDVVRRRIGDGLILFDGEGHQAEGRIALVDRHHVQVEVATPVFRAFDSPIKLTLATALPRAHRQPYLFEKCTELGVWRIRPTQYARSVIRPKPSAVEKWRRTSIEACKQCGRNWVPRIEAPQSFAQTLARISEFDTFIVTGVHEQFAPIADCLRGMRDALSRTVLVWIGPEGGLTADEIDAALSAGTIGAHLGPRTLRLETAAAAVAALVTLSERSGVPG